MQLKRRNEELKSICEEDEDSVLTHSQWNNPDKLVVYNKEN